MKKRQKINKTEAVKHYVLYFFTFAIIGWLAEVLVVFLMSGQLVNAGVLLGPWVPIYAWASLLVIFLSRRIKNNWAFFGVIMVVAGLIEYLTSLWLERQHHARWWDYSALPLNINGRVCLWVLAIFSVIGLFCVRVVVPLLDNFYNKINGHLFNVVLVILVLVFAVDWFHSSEHPNKTPGMPYDSKKTLVSHPLPRKILTKNETSFLVK